MASPGVTRGTWGISVRSLQANESLYEHNPRALLVPGSIAKLVALAVTVDTVGWDFTFDTSLRATGPIEDGTLRGDLLVVGSGDPSIGGRGGDDLTPFIEALKQAGIRRIDGRIIGDDDAIDEPRPGAMWAWDDLGYTSGALFGALNYGENRLPVTVTPSETAGTPTTLSVPAWAEDRPLINRSTTSARGSTALLWPEQRPGEVALTIAGTLPVGSRSSGLFVSAGNPTRWYAGVFRRELLRAGIEVTGSPVDIDDLTPKPDTSAAGMIYLHHSKSLGELAQPMLKNSINLYSEAVLRMSTGLAGGRTNDDALAAVHSKLTSWGVPADSFQVVDAAGLSRRDTIAAETIIAILARMHDPADASPWMTGLPVAGRDGTLASRMKDSAAQNNLRAKTGTMSNIRSLAGYVRTKDDEPLAFVIMVNNFEGTGQEALTAIDKIAEQLAGFSRK